MILLTDANILIDLGHVSALNLLSSLAPTEVLSTVLLECEHPSQPTLVSDIRACGIQVIEVEDVLVTNALAYSNTDLSLPDRQGLLYARERGRVLLSGDGPVREAAKTLEVEVHGTIWLIEQARARGLYPNHELCRWLTVLALARRRLPREELRRLKEVLGC